MDISKAQTRGDLSPEDQHYMDIIDLYYHVDDKLLGCVTKERIEKVIDLIVPMLNK